MTSPLNPPKHPAKFSEPILTLLAAIVRREHKDQGRPVHVFDPFAGVGRVHRLAASSDDILTYGMEIEPEWAACHERTVPGDSLKFMHKDPVPTPFDIVVTSPCYGNRLSDHHNAQDGSVRRSYTHDLGRLPTAGSSATLAWGPAYWTFHAQAWAGVHRILKPGGLFVLNVSDFVRGKFPVHAVDWHDGVCWGVGFTRGPRDRRKVTTRRLRHGENATARADHEAVLTYRRHG